jgi:hypothetical protein
MRGGIIVVNRKFIPTKVAAFSKRLLRRPPQHVGEKIERVQVAVSTWKIGGD